MVVECKGYDPEEGSATGGLSYLVYLFFCEFHDDIVVED
jgi:hypothetical protein